MAHSLLRAARWSSARLEQQQLDVRVLHEEPQRGEEGQEHERWCSNVCRNSMSAHSCALGAYAPPARPPVRACPSRDPNGQKNASVWGRALELA